MMVGAMAADLSTELDAWAASGAMWLTGRADGPPLGPPERLVPGVRALGERLGLEDPLQLLGERAAEMGTTRDGARSCGGATSLLRAADGWLALTLARDDDADLLPAWLGLEAPPALEDRWTAVEQAVAAQPIEELVESGVELGLPLGAVPEPSADVGGPVLRAVVGSADPRPVAGALVIDLSSLWAGPLCGALLAAAGADVVKVESTRRPDGARQGPPGFFDLVNARKRSVALDLSSLDGQAALRELIARADVVIEASRPRALAQMGIDAEAMLAGEGGPTVWLSITGHGRDQPLRVGFGDDAAAAGGLVVWDDQGPCFCADAVADPLTGMLAAVEVLESLSRGGAELLDVSLARVAASMAGPTLPVPERLIVARPRARSPQSKAPALGAHTAEVLASL
jgi:crotonobetainyl-CoA:carnitine CoA-transferase CaiB-like acyl-CoA transferase